MAKPSNFRNTPSWLQDLDLDPSLLEKVRKEAITIRERDIYSFRELTPAERTVRQRRLRLASPWRIPPWILWAVVITVLFIAFQVFNLSDYAFQNRILVLIGVTIGMVAVSILVNRRYQTQLFIPYFSAALRRHGIIVCPRCGYHVAHRTEDPVCPECGLKDSDLS